MELFSLTSPNIPPAYTLLGLSSARDNWEKENMIGQHLSGACIALQINMSAPRYFLDKTP